MNFVQLQSTLSIPSASSQVHMSQTTSLIFSKTMVSSEVQQSTSSIPSQLSQSVFLQSSSFPMMYYPPSSGDFHLPPYSTTYYPPLSSAMYQSPLEAYVYKTFNEIRLELESLDRRIAELRARM